jgi:hypothetical protein
MDDTHRVLRYRWWLDYRDNIENEDKIAVRKILISHLQSLQKIDAVQFKH